MCNMLKNIQKKFYEPTQKTRRCLKKTLFAQPRANFKRQKKLFSNLDEASVLARRIFSMNFLSMLHMCKMFIRVQASDWYNLEHHTTRRNDYLTGESNFCRISENHTPKYGLGSKRNFLILTEFQGKLFFQTPQKIFS